MLVDRIWFKCAPGAKKFMVIHELGHILDGDLHNPELVGITPSMLHIKKGVHPIEAAADHYAMSRCTTTELIETWALFLVMGVLSIIDPGMRDLKYRARSIKAEIKRRKSSSVACTEADLTAETMNRLSNKLGIKGTD